ncbi:WhiB family transcriptional regulator [Streptomyces sp. NPDC059597]|uniref:WhiB family transcriptional regulator n=1 Tax=Streptomyces sp. NPDC059597 TaxID=3346879 RepID=UPI00368D87F1
MSSYLPAADTAVAWARDAACRGMDLDDFFTDSERGISQAKQICARCPVRTQCLEEVLRAESTCRYGIYGGLTPKERGSLMIHRRKQVAA